MRTQSWPELSPEARHLARRRLGPELNGGLFLCLSAQLCSAGTASMQLTGGQNDLAWGCASCKASSQALGPSLAY